MDGYGRVWKHLDSRRGHGKIDPPRRAERGAPGGYQQVRFVHNGRRLSGTAHRLVYRALKGPIPTGYEINHNDGVKDNNHPDNLSPETPSGNVKHAFRIGLKDEHGERNPAAKLSNDQVAEIRSLYSTGGWTMLALADKFGVSFQHISRLIRNQRRVKQLGPTSSVDLRHSAGPRDPVTGRFTHSQEFPQ